MGLLSAIGRSIVSYFSSPWGYLRKTVAELAMGGANPRILDTDHFLLNRFISSAKVAVVIATVLGVAAIATSAVYALLPPFYLRQQFSNLMKQGESVRQASERLTQQLTREDQDWQANSAQMITKVEADRQKGIFEAKSQIEKDQASISKDADGARVLQSLESFFVSRQGQLEATEEAKGFVKRMPLTDLSTTQLLLYCEHWRDYQERLGSLPLSADAVRRRLQPAHDQAARELVNRNAELEMNRRLTAQTSLEISNSYHPELMLLTLLVGGVFLHAYIWAAGLGLELLSMGFYVSNDVKQIRANSPRLQQSAAAASGGRP
jgi:hypothetical protein